MTRYHCDNCTYEFIPLMDKKHIEADVWRVYVPCPRCGHRHTAYYYNSKIKKMCEDKADLGLIEEEMEVLRREYEDG